MLARLYRLLWHIFYLYVCIRNILKNVKLRLQALTLWSYDFCRSQVSIERRNYLFFQKHKTKLTKLPTHLNIIIGPENRDVNEKVLTRIFKYALQMNISYISFYDTRPIDAGHVNMRKIDTPKHIHSEELHKHHLKWTVLDPNAHVNGTTLNGKIVLNGSAKHKLSNGAINGKSNGVHKPQRMTGHTIEIFKITDYAGRNLLTEVCRDLFKIRHTQEIQELLKDRNSLMDRINIELSKRMHGLPDPELSLVFNEHTCSYGMMPWQTRFTEFHTLNSRQYFNESAFMNVLYRYSRCEQRWGK
ncbi:dehydrodolichyl diphosphate synthase complex subunit nus1 [Teleopsis dalmanni]|uniref:dehydrodolichyl diphosphate synthase complex subunit nus1 n=1 Tax=Teleopsis dalmanni TaxID=139649 RepID=UPI0018CF33AB|nr:dehydrodolichyl diphosphate synthase complex subunit nus1 [Teleopsis dalmanni]XP_037960935.1 dehydrodolichyl diphosphate synthase complex subunit nus1 [Teleopsis dalmanni]XP_037960936.1 dehydrodolichyl diphosphate synthase complex subunit nus1 [Teleopsis dalmanni]XP_037960937.1 dehydrodolichyl diphosphate synthase complex subunit nus1 [Teleopsis dalmanni]